MSATEAVVVLALPAACKLLEPSSVWIVVGRNVAAEPAQIGMVSAPGLCDRIATLERERIVTMDVLQKLVECRSRQAVEELQLAAERILARIDGEAKG